MAEENTTANPQAGDAAQIDPQPQAGTTTTPEPQAGEGQNDTISLEEAKKLRSEAANLRKRLKAFEDAETKAREAQLTEQERREKQLADLQKAHDDAIRQHQEYKVSTEVRLQAAQMGFADLSDATRLLDLSELTYNEDGTPNNVKDLLGKLLKAKPYLAGKPVSAPTSGGATNPPRSQSTTHALSWETITNMKPDEYASRRKEIQQWMNENPVRFGSRLSH